MAQATRTVGPGTTIRDAKTASNVILAQGNVSADANTTEITVDRPCLVNVEMVLGTIASGVSDFDVEIQGSDVSGFGSGVVSYGHFDTVGPSDDDTTRVLSCQVYKKYMRAVIDYTGSGNCNVGIFVRTPYDRRADSTTA
jgi:hypothetical protein